MTFTTIILAALLSIGAPDSDAGACTSYYNEGGIAVPNDKIPNDRAYQRYCLTPVVRPVVNPVEPTYPRAPRHCAEGATGRACGRA